MCHLPPRVVAILHQGVDPPERPPPEIKIADALAELGGARLGDEKIHIGHLHRVDAVAGHETADRVVQSRRGLGEPALL